MEISSIIHLLQYHIVGKAVDILDVLHIVHMQYRQHLPEI